MLVARGAWAKARGVVSRGTELGCLFRSPSFKLHGRNNGCARAPTWAREFAFPLLLHTSTEMVDGRWWPISRGSGHAVLPDTANPVPRPGTRSFQVSCAWWLETLLSRPSTRLFAHDNAARVVHEERGG